MYKRIAIVSATVVLAACGGSDSSEVTINDVRPDAGEAELSRIAFNPSDGVLPLPSDLLFSGTTDGTLEPPDEAEAKELGEDLDLGNPGEALGGVDGWSTMFPMQISVDLVGGATIDGTSVGASTVLMFETITPPTDGSASACQIPTVTTPGLPCGVVSVLTYGVDYVAVSSADSITVAPLSPLNASTTYVVALAPGLLDSSGEAIAASEFYEVVTQDPSVQDVENGTLGSLQDAINLYEAIVAIGTGGNPLAAEDMVYTAAWTTGSVGVGVSAATSVLAATPPSIASIGNVGGSPVSVTVEDALIGSGALPPTLDGLTGLDNALLMQGEITLPYYSGTPVDGTDPILQGWSARCDNALATAGARAAGLDSVEPNNTICSTINPALGDFGEDTQRFVTQFNPVPLVRDTPTIDVQITVPAFGSNWPVVILQHGITSRKEDMLGLAGALSANGFATFAIDHPLHGTRGLVSAELGGAEANATSRSETSATDYMNLAYLLAGKSNLDQSMADLLGLRMAIGFSLDGDLVTGDFDTSNVQFVGQSLGGISGVGFVSIANTLDAALPLDLAVERGALASPGGGIVPLLFSSDQFSGLVIGSVLAGAGLTLADPQNVIDATLGAFAFAAQTVIDGSDPNNFAASLAAQGTSIYMSEVVGGETVNDLPDTVIPNQSDFAGLVFGGTEPLAAFLGLGNVNTLNSGAESGIVRFDQGSHGSLLNGDVATTEMQTQVISFLSGLGIVVSADTVILGQ